MCVRERERERECVCDCVLIQKLGTAQASIYLGSQSKILYDLKPDSAAAFELSQGAPSASNPENPIPLN